MEKDGRRLGGQTISMLGQFEKLQAKAKAKVASRLGKV
jgi:hypothetical protein